MLVGLSVASNFSAHAADDKESSKQGFMAAIADDHIVDALADFERHQKKGAWEKAFESLNQLYEVEEVALLRSKS